MEALFHVASHAGNCHGEWTIWVPMLMSFIDSLPYLGTWLSARKSRSDPE